MMILITNRTANQNSLTEYFVFVSGRVHSAVVSGINADTYAVTVEWFEQNETKGKEVSNWRFGD